MKNKNEFLERLVSVTNRSKAQTLFLLDLLDNDVFLLMELEEKLKNNHLHYCPSTIDEVNEVLSMGNGSGWLKFTFQR